MSIKRIILAHNSRLLREMFHRVINRAEFLEIVEEVHHNEDLLFAIQRFCPDWVIVSLPLPDFVLDCLNAWIENDPSVRFIFFSEDNRSVKMYAQMTSEEDLSNLSLKAFLSILEKDLQQI